MTAAVEHRQSDYSNVAKWGDTHMMTFFNAVTTAPGTIEQFIITSIAAIIALGSVMEYYAANELNNVSTMRLTESPSAAAPK